MSDINSDFSETESENVDVTCPRHQDEPSITSPLAAVAVGNTIETGTDTQSEYDIKSGLFVVIKQLQHKFTHDGHQWYKEKKPLTYDTDWERLCKLFGLTASSKNLLLGEDLHPTLTSEERHVTSNVKMFEDFMEDVKTHIKNEVDSITFVLVILMSHGFKDGSFLLSRKDEFSQRQGCNCPPLKRTDEEIQKGYKKNMRDHLFRDHCNARKAYDHVIKPIQAMEELNGKPKLFFVQTCRGNEPCVVGVKAGPPKRSIEADRFVPIGSDTLVFYATIQDTFSWVINGSLFLQAFCKTAEKIKENTAQETHVKNLMIKLKEKEKICRSIRTAPAETYLNAWMLDVCRDVSSLVSKDLFTLNVERGDTVDTIPYQKQQPEYQCSLRRRLSFLKLLRSTSL